MKIESQSESEIIRSAFLKREVTLDFYSQWQKEDLNNCDLLLINDGQDLVTMDFKSILQKLYDKNKISRLLCVGIHCWHRQEK